MSNYESNIELSQAVRRIYRSQRIEIVTHAKPDGDAYGSVVAMTASLQGLGRTVSASFMPPIPENLRELTGSRLVDLYKPSADLPDPDLMLILDTGAWSQVSPMRDRINSFLNRTLIVDHHVAGDLPAAWRYVDPEAAACCEIVAQMIDQLQGQQEVPFNLFDSDVCEALFVGIASDTGWFRFSNTRPETHELASRLIRLGVDNADLYRRLEQRARPEKLALQVRALTSLQLVADRRVAIMVLREKDFLETGAFLEETERFVDMPQSVTTVQLVVLITETPMRHKPATNGQVCDHHPPASGQTIRLSFRSKPGPRAINVAKLAGQFGGGGHERAAGAKVSSPIDEVVTKVTDATVAAVEAT